MPDLKIKKHSLKKLFDKLSRERELLQPKRLETKNQSTKISKPNKRLKTKQPKKHRKRLLEARRNDSTAI
jgi:hypothetical protein